MYVAVLECAIPTLLYGTSQHSLSVPNNASQSISCSMVARRHLPALMWPSTIGSSYPLCSSPHEPNCNALFRGGGYAYPGPWPRAAWMGTMAVHPFHPPPGSPALRRRRQDLASLSWPGKCRDPAFTRPSGEGNGSALLTPLTNGNACWKVPSFTT